MFARLLMPLVHAPFISIFFMGLFYTLAFAPFYIFPLGLLSIGTLFFLTRRLKKPHQAFMLGLMFGLVHNLSALYWIPQSFYITTQSISDTLIYGGGALLLLCAYLAIFPALTCYALHKLSRSFVWAPLVFTTFWVLGEVLRSILFTGFPWNLTGYIFADVPILMQGAAWGGVYTLSALAVYISAGLTMGKDHIITSTLLFCFTIYMGLWYLNLEENEVGQSGLAVRLIQPNISQEDKWEPKEQERILRRMIELSTENINNSTPDIIIWPETAVATTFLEESLSMRKRLGDIMENDQQLLITGGLRRVSINAQDEYFNSIITLNNQGDITRMYDKVHLVPFGEYIPFRDWLPERIQKIFAASVDYTSGVGDPLMKLSLKGGEEITALSLVCFEAIFPGEVARYAKEADFILNITNDAWFAGTIGPQQHFAMARMRAVETGLPIVRVGNTGVTALIGPSGKVLRDIRSEKTGHVHAILPSARKIRPPFAERMAR